MHRQVWQTEKAGDIGRLTLCHDDLPVLAPDKVRIKVKAIGLNFADIFALTGLYSATPEGAFIPGLEFAGVVESVGSHVDSWQIGQPVMAVTRFGAYASVIDVGADYCFALPEGWSMAEGAAYPVQTLTAWYALNRLGAAKSGQTVLIQSAAGGVGLQALHICRELGLKAIPVVGTSQKVDFLNGSGFPGALIRNHSFLSHLDEYLKGEGIDLILDGVGGALQKDLFQRLAPMGRLIVFGAAEFTPGRRRPNYLKALWKYLMRPRYDVLQMISDNRSVMAFNLIWLWQQVGEMQTMMGELSQLSLPAPHVGQTFAFQDAPAAIEALRSGTSVGKVVLLVD